MALDTTGLRDSALPSDALHGVWQKVGQTLVKASEMPRGTFNTLERVRKSAAHGFHRAFFPL